MKAANGTSPTDFHDSFSSHMIRDFFLVLIGVILLELAISFAMVVYDYETQQPERVAQIADSLASDVRSIMLNEGGPVAARTVYPILDKDHEAIGMAISIEPSEITVEAIEARFEFTPRGIPATWPEGKFTEARVEVLAEDTCIGCHITAGAGDVLGVVTVRRYLDAQLVQWWDKLPVSLTLGMGKILLHTIVLYFLLKSRMASLLSLKSVVSLLAKSGSTLEHRAPVNSHDEFGELARDLNLFLDRVAHITEDLDGVLTRIIGLNVRLSDTQSNIVQRYESVQAQATALIKSSAVAQDAAPALDSQWVDAMRESLHAVARQSASVPDSSAPGADVERLVGYLRQCADDAQAARRGLGGLGENMADLSGDLRAFAAPLREMALIENSMSAISEQGQALLERLNGSAESDQAE